MRAMVQRRQVVVKETGTEQTVRRVRSPKLKGTTETLSAKKQTRVLGKRNRTTKKSRKRTEKLKMLQSRMWRMEVQVKRMCSMGVVAVEMW